jgi:1-acyl-sn-glycerol-3-phosphate acyltransferase
MNLKGGNMKKSDMEKEIAKLKEEISELKSKMLALALTHNIPIYPIYPVYPAPQPITNPATTYPWSNPTITWGTATTTTSGIAGIVS